MMKRLFTLIVGTLLICSTSWANEEYNITLEKGEAQGKTIELLYGNISFRLVEYGDSHKVLVSIDNTTLSQAILLFKSSIGEKALKKNKPRTGFEKTYPGSKGYRNVFGCKELNQSFVSIIPQDKMDLFESDVSLTTVTKLELPVYLAKYDPKQLIRKGAHNTRYKILSEDILTFNIEITGWTEDDSDYVLTKNAVEDYLRSVDTVAFCVNEKHTPSLSQQQRPYQEKKDSLVNAIEMVVTANGWMSDTAPYKAYKALRDQLEKVNLNDRTYDCGEHKVEPKPHSCAYCSLSAQQIYHQLDDLYQHLRNAKTSKEAAVKKAQGLYTCYQRNGRRKKDASYTDKISKFYSRITNY